MAKRRLIDTKFWTDTYIVELDPIEKLGFLYFITCPYSTISGVYEISLRQAAFETGIDKDQLQRLLDRFALDGKMKYQDGWIAIKNFPKHQATSSEKIQVAISYELGIAPQWAVDWMELAAKHTPMKKKKRTQIPVAVRRKLLKDFENTCAECGRFGEGVILEVDHLLPVSMGGTNDIENLRILCSRCNGKRNAQMRWDNHTGWATDTAPIKMGEVSTRTPKTYNNNNNSNNTNNLELLNDIGTVEPSKKSRKPIKQRIKKEQVDALFDEWEQVVGYRITATLPTNREYAADLIREYAPIDITAMLRGVSLSQSDQYAPRIANFIQLYKKWDDLKAWGKRRSSSSQGKVAKI